MVAWHSGRTSVSDWRTFPVLRSTCSWSVTTNVGKPSATGQPTWPTQPFILSGSYCQVYGVIHFMSPVGWLPVQIQLHKSHRHPNLPDFRLPATHTAHMAASAQQCCTSFSTSQSSNRQYASNHQIIEAHPNWPVCADVFQRPPPRLAPQCPIWSDMTTQLCRREDWSMASVVNHTIVTEATIQQPSFDLSLIMHGLWWTISWQVKARYVLTCTNVVSTNHITVIVARDRPWTILLTRAH